MRGTGRLRIWPLIGLAVVMGVAALVLVAVAVAPGGLFSDVVQTVTAVLTLTGGLVLWLWNRSSRGLPISAGVLASAGDGLAATVLAQWERAAVERRLRYPAPIPVRWRWSHRAVTGPVEEALGTAGPARFAPLPGIAAATAATVGDGGIGDLSGVLGGLDSGRVIVLGDAGTGKSAAAILTVLDALRHRQGLDHAQRAAAPVPVLLTAHGWDPHYQRLDEWLVAQLNADYPFLRSVAYGRNAAARLVDSGRVALVLDGFDEIADELRPTAIRALDRQALFRLMVLTRTCELVDAVADGHLHGAAALELLPVPAPEAADYLIRCQVQPPAPPWRRLAEHLRSVPDSMVSTALDTPLMLTLVRDAFPVPGDLDDLLTQGRFTSRAEAEDYLLDRVLPTAYRPRPGEQPAPYSVERAHRWLSFLATKMNHSNTRDLAWWHIRQWAPAPTRVVIMAIPPALGAGAALGAVYGLMFGLAGGLMAGLACGLANGVAVGLVMGLRDGRGSALASGLAGGLASAITAATAFGITVGLAKGAAAGIVTGLAAALGLGLPSGIAAALVEARRMTGPRRLRPLRWRAVASRGSLAVGLGFGLVIGLSDGLAFGLTGGFVAGLAVGAVIGLAVTLLFGILNGLVQGFADATSPADPITCWRCDRQSGLTEGLAYGITCGIAFGLAGCIVAGTWTGLALGLTVGLVEALAVTIAVSQSWVVTLEFLLLGHADIFPRQGIRFLEDARQRGVLRTVGSVYQFRHARLQDQLAEANTSMYDAPDIG